MRMSDGELETRLQLSIQRALWDLVTPNLRAIAVRIESPVIHARFMYNEVSLSEAEIVSEVEAYVAADFIPPLEPCFLPVSVADGVPRSLDEGEFWVYRRAEKHDVGLRKAEECDRR